jgi:hypothetical protein
MRLHYYRFPDTVDAQTRFINGAAAEGGGECGLGRESCRACDICGDGWTSCPRFLVSGAEDTLSGISITRAKQLLQQFGGAAWTSHIERDGGVFETTAITLGGNNSRHKYSRHL